MFQPGVLEHADLREPLAEEEVVGNPAGARRRERNAAGPLDLDLHRGARADGCGQRDGHHRAIGGVAVVGCDVADRLGEVGGGAAGGRDLDRRDVAGAGVFGPPSGVTRPARAPERAGDPRAATSSLVPPRVPVQVELQFVGRGAADVAPADGLPAFDFLAGRRRAGPRCRSWRCAATARRAAARRTPGRRLERLVGQPGAGLLAADAKTRSRDQDRGDDDRKKDTPAHALARILDRDDGPASR